MRTGHFTQESTAKKTAIDRNTHFGTFKFLTMNSSNTAGDRPLPSYDDKVDIPVVAEFVEATGTDDPRPNYPTGPPVEVFTTMESNVLE